MSHFFAYLSRMKYIKRWGLMKSTTPENIQEHSLQVAMIAHGLALIKNRFFNGRVDAERVMTLAVYHEAGEVITGDLATPIKYFNPEIKTAYKKIERIAHKKLYDMLPSGLKPCYDSILFKTQQEEEHWKLVKAADKISAYVKCIDELSSGNQEFSKARRSIEQELEDMMTPEIRYFLDEFIESFELTLDELD